MGCFSSECIINEHLKYPLSMRPSQSLVTSFCLPLQSMVSWYSLRTTRSIATRSLRHFTFYAKRQRCIGCISSFLSSLTGWEVVHTVNLVSVKPQPQQEVVPFARLSKRLNANNPNLIDFLISIRVSTTTTMMVDLSVPVIHQLNIRIHHSLLHLSLL